MTKSIKLSQLLPIDTELGSDSDEANQVRQKLYIVVIWCSGHSIILDHCWHSYGWEGCQVSAQPIPDSYYTSYYNIFLNCRHISESGISTETCDQILLQFTESVSSQRKLYHCIGGQRTTLLIHLKLFQSQCVLCNYYLFDSTVSIVILSHIDIFPLNSIIVSTLLIKIW